MPRKGTGNRKHGEGSFRQKANGKWEGAGWVAEVEKRVYVTGETEKDARNKLKAKIEEVRTGKAPARRAGVTFYEYAGEEIRTRDGIGQRSRDIYTDTLENYLKPLHRKKLDAITPEMVRGAYAELRKYSMTVRTNAHTLTRLVFRQAIKDGKVKTNPTDDARPKSERGARGREVLAYTPEQAAMILEAAGKVRYGEVVAFLLFTGMRRGEMCFLRWKHVDLQANKVLVEGTRGMTASAEGGIYEGKPKTDQSNRSVPLMPEAVTLLRGMRAKCLPYDAAQYVFVTTAGNPIRPDVVREPLQLAVRNINRERETAGAAPIPLLKVHALRHTFVSIMAQRSVRLEVISKWIGDDPTTVMRTYLHVFNTDMDMPSLNLGEFSREVQPG